MGRKSQLKLTLMSRITCEGNKQFGVEKFYITSNNRVPNNRRDNRSNRAFLPVFSHLMVNYSRTPQEKSAGETPPSTVVKVMAIVHIKSANQHWRELGHVVLLVARMIRAKPVSGSNFPFERLSYSFDGSNMNFDVIELDSIRQPVCVIPEFSITQPVYFIEKLADRMGKNFAKKLKFLLVPNNSLIDDANIGVEEEDIGVEEEDDSVVDEDEEDKAAEKTTNFNSLTLDQSALDTLDERTFGKEEETDSDASSTTSSVDEDICDSEAEEEKEDL